MNTNDLRNIIKEKTAEEKRTKELKSELAKSVGNKVATEVVKFVEGYVSLTPDLMDKVYAAAQQHNLLNNFQPIFGVIFNYWLEEYDYIPDHLGLRGICDDAYMSLSLMHLIANTEVQNTGRLLPGLDLSEMNRNMSVLLGPGITSQLNETVSAAYNSAFMQDSISTIFNMIGGGVQLGSTFSGMQNMLDNYRMQESIDTQLGAMGIF
jgi:uncharacterized membrane protein YkvA (DUF1232 family)